MEEHLPAKQAPFFRSKKLHCFKRRPAQILPPCFVCLTHKTNPDIKIRANVSNNNVLKPVLDNAPAHVENNLELIKCIQTGDLTANKALRYPCSLDIVFLYTPKPIEEAITNAAERIQKPILHLSKQERVDLLTVTLRNMYFSFKVTFSTKVKAYLSILAFRVFWPSYSWTNALSSKLLTRDMSTIFIFRQLMKK